MMKNKLSLFGGVGISLLVVVTMLLLRFPVMVVTSGCECGHQRCEYITEFPGFSKLGEDIINEGDSQHKHVFWDGQDSGEIAIVSYIRGKRYEDFK